jgi:hypothetical protein
MKAGKYVLVNVIVPVILGINIGSLLIIISKLGNAPGLYVLALIIITGLISWFIKNTQRLKSNNHLLTLVSLLAGSISIIYFTLYMLEGLYDEPPGVLIMGIPLVLSLYLISIIKADNNTKGTGNK